LIEKSLSSLSFSPPTSPQFYYSSFLLSSSSSISASSSVVTKKETLSIEPTYNLGYSIDFEITKIGNQSIEDNY